MKKLITILVLITCFMMTACGGETDKDTEKDTSSVVEDGGNTENSENRDEDEFYIDIETAQKNRKLFTIGDDYVSYTDGKILYGNTYYELKQTMTNYTGLTPICLAADNYMGNIAIVDEEGNTFYETRQVFQGEKIRSICFDFQISPGRYGLYGVTEDGRVLATGGDSGYGEHRQLDISGAADISASANYLIALKKDGTAQIIFTGNGEDENQWSGCDVSSWDDLAQVMIGEIREDVDDTDSYCAIGLKNDGTIVASGTYPSEILEWENIVSIATDGRSFIAGLKSDGTVIMAGPGAGQNEYMVNLQAWENITAITDNRGMTTFGGIGTDGHLYGYAINLNSAVDFSGEIVDVDLIDAEY